VDIPLDLFGGEILEADIGGHHLGHLPAAGAVADEKAGEHLVGLAAEAASICGHPPGNPACPGCGHRSARWCPPPAPSCGDGCGRHPSPWHAPGSQRTPPVRMQGRWTRRIRWGSPRIPAPPDAAGRSVAGSWMRGSAPVCGLRLTWRFLPDGRAFGKKGIEAESSKLKVERGRKEQAEAVQTEGCQVSYSEPYWLYLLLTSFYRSRTTDRHERFRLPFL
jgi:hypothetical protein